MNTFVRRYLRYLGMFILMTVFFNGQREGRFRSVYDIIPYDIHTICISYNMNIIQRH